MKTLIATTITALISTSALAWQPQFDSQEFYEGRDGTPLRIAAQSSDSTLYVEGNADTGNTSEARGNRIGHAHEGNDSGIYREGNYDV